MIIIRYISDIMNIHRPIFFITAGIMNLDLICRWYICFLPNLLRLCDPKCMVSGMCSEMFAIIRHFRVPSAGRVLF